jgi:hypothetical protein
VCKSEKRVCASGRSRQERNIKTHSRGSPPQTEFSASIYACDIVPKPGGGLAAAGKSIWSVTYSVQY